MYKCIVDPLYVSSLEIELATLVFWDNAPTNCDTWAGPTSISSGREDNSSHKHSGQSNAGRDNDYGK